MTSTFEDPIFWCLVAAVAAIAVGLLVIRRSRTVIANQRAALTAAQSRLAGLEAEHAKAVGAAEVAAEERTKTVLKFATRTLQGLAAEQQVVIDGLQRTYGGHPVLSDLLEVNHANAQFARRSQTIAVLCGGFLGRRQEPASVYDVVRSAQGQIRNFERVQIRSQSSFAVVAQAVSAVSLAVAELLANAAGSSPRDTAIEVNIRPVHNGICIIIDDFGVGMSEEQKQRASALLSGEFIPHMSELGNPPQFGFPAIAEVSRRYGFSVDVSSTSPYGGVRAVVLVPQELLTEEAAERTSSPATVKTAPDTDPGTDSTAADASAPAARTQSGLPKRAARQTPSVAVLPTRESSGTPDGSAEEDSREDSRVAAARMVAFQQGTKSGRQPVTAQHEGSEHQ